MPDSFFKDLFDNCPAAVVVCAGGETGEVVYANPPARQLAGGHVCSPPADALPGGTLTLEGRPYRVLYPRRAPAPCESELMLQILQTITNSGGDIVYVTDMHTHELVFVNRAMCDYLGKPADSILGLPCWKAMHKGMLGPCGQCRMPQVSPEGLQYAQWERENAVTGKWYRVQCSIIKWTNGSDMRLSVMSEITLQKEREARLEHIATRDMLTGVHNRAWGHKLLSEMLAPRQTPENSSLVFIDLDGLKLVNDTYGHQAGDRFIREIIDIIQTSVRKSDAIFRWGGDEFILILRCPVPQAQAIMQSISREVEARNSKSAAPYDLGFSYGVVALRSGEGTVEQLVDSADKLMYLHKAGK